MYRHRRIFFELNFSYQLAIFIVPDIETIAVAATDDQQVVIDAHFHARDFLAVEVVLELAQHRAIR